MKERPIIFCGDMVKALLAGTKTQTRRLQGLDEINASPNGWKLMGENLADDFIFESNTEPGDRIIIACSFGVAGDRLWVREAFKTYNEIGSPQIFYRATHPEILGPWRPSIHMPRWASRITLEITKVRVERLQSISEEDAVAEGCPEEWHESPSTPDGPGEMEGYSAIQDFAALWDSLHGKGAWDKNPFVWVLEFRRL